ncbi:MAG: hypothetical protein ACLPH3_08470 [Terracidiphilus sp.]
MNSKLHEPVYNAAIDLARTDLREIADLIDLLRARQEQIYAAVEALELVVSAEGQPAEARPALKPVYEMSNRNSQPSQNSSKLVDPKVLNPIEPRLKEAVRVQALA